MSLRNTAVIALWFISNFIGLVLIAFSERPIIKLIALVYETWAISTSGLVSIGSMFCTYEHKPDEAMERLRKRFSTNDPA